MRECLIVLLVRLTPIILLTANVARADPALRPSLKSASSFFGMMYHSARRSTYREPSGSAEEFSVIYRCCSSVGPERVKFVAPGDKFMRTSAQPADRRRSRLIATPRMIIWGLCSTPNNGSAFSIYASSGNADESGQGASIAEDVLSDQCAVDEEEESEESVSVGRYWRATD
jgi:hypothetical protein